MGPEAKKPTGSLLSGQKLVGTKVENPRGEGLGKIEDVMISAETGRVAYAVVSFGGVLSLGNKLFAFPWSALRVDGLKKRVILNLDRKTLARARGFDKDHWPDSSTWDWDDPMPVTPETAQAPRLEAPPLIESPAMEKVTSDKTEMEQWGKTWQSHGLDRS